MSLFDGKCKICKQSESLFYLIVSSWICVRCHGEMDRIRKEKYMEDIKLREKELEGLAKFRKELEISKKAVDEYLSQKKKKWGMNKNGF